jgi:microcystin-dependent protein
MILTQLLPLRGRAARAIESSRLFTAALFLLAAGASLGLPGSSRAQTPYLGEVRLVSFNFAPKGWAFCDGQVLSINQNQALFSLLGTQFGGNGQTTFALPDLRGRVVVSSGQGPGLSNYNVGDRGGVEAVALNTAQLPPHNHLALESPAPGTSATPASGSVLVPPTLLPARDGAAVPHYGPNLNTQLSPAAIGFTGAGLAHENRPPGLVLRYIIALQGIFPSRNAPGVVQPDAAPSPAPAAGSR